MSKLTLCLPLLAASLNAAAQSAITLTASTFPAGPTTVERYQPAGPGSLPTTGLNQAWDYRSLTPAGAAYSDAYQAPPATGGIAGAQWARTSELVLGNLAYTYTSFYNLKTNGVVALGRTVTRQARGLGVLTGAATDSVVINRQTIPYGPAGVVSFPLPLTTGSYARQQYRIAVAGTLTIQAAGLSQVPLRIIQRYQYADSVAGSGTLRLPAAGFSTGSPALPVLLVRSRFIRQDSFLLAGAPAPAALLAAFGVTQGQATTSYYDSFWRQGSAQSALELDYSNSTYSTLLYSFYSVEPTLLAARVPQALPGVALYPNPAPVGSSVVLTAEEGGPQPVALTVRDLLGRTVATGTSRTGQPTAVLAGLLPGSYLLELRTTDGQLATRRVSVQ